MAALRRTGLRPSIAIGTMREITNYICIVKFDQ